jgi:hypothetical protein
MKKALLSVGAVCLVIFLAVSFSAATCTVTPGPISLYKISLTNTYGENLRIEIWDTTGWVTREDWQDVPFTFPIYTTGSVYGYYGQYFRVYSYNTLSYYTFIATGNTWYLITGTESPGGWTSSER